MHLPGHGLIYLALLVGTLLLFQRLKRAFWLFALLILPGTLCHELCHLCIGGLLYGKPTRFSLLPKREGTAFVMGSVAFAHVRWYNAFFLGMAPVLLLPAALGLLLWRLKGHPAFSWSEAAWLYLIANLVYASLPSWQDLRVAARSPIGWLLLAGATAYGWYCFHYHQVPGSGYLQQLEIFRLSGLHAPLGNPGADIPLGKPHKISGAL
jgi:hypothetical protein